ncbi:MAG TPA: 6-phosphogluconolactonase [Chthoniobacterales bacterium]|nr:6-phosphogluconolactonase [Chthoniobacterales bacterium]
MPAAVTRTKDFAKDAAEFILQKAWLALGERDEFRLALSGGSTPRPVYQELARRSFDLPWERVFVTFGDERCVPPEHERSNYRMARESLFLPAAVPERSIARMRGEIDPHLAAQEYEDELGVLAAQKGEMIYRHDLILLGLGDDGHTASLFPGTSALDEQIRRVAANFVPQLNEWRLTFTYPLLAQARAICFLIDGRKDRALLEGVLAGDSQYPAARVSAPNGEITWFLAEPANET